MDHKFKTILQYSRKRTPDIKIETQSVWVFVDNFDGSSRTKAIKKLIHLQPVQLAWLPENDNGEIPLYIFGSDNNCDLDMSTCVGQVDKYLSKNIIDFIHSDLYEGINSKFIEPAGGACGVPILGCIIHIDIFIDNMKSEMLGNTSPICPYCNSELTKMPLRKSVCKVCKKEIYSKKIYNGKNILMTDENNNRLLEYRSKIDGLYYHSIK